MSTVIENTIFFDGFRFGFHVGFFFMRFLPMIAVSEVKGVVPQADPHHPLGGAKSGGHH